MSDLRNRRSRGDGSAARSSVPEAEPDPSSLGRRDFLKTTALAGLALSSLMSLQGVGSAFAAPAEGAVRFGSLSSFVTRHEGFNPALVERAYSQLKALDPKFDAKLDALSKAIRNSGAKSMDAFLASNPTSDVRDTMTTITGVWYLGYTGTPDPSQETDNAKFVTYRDALMWGPTSDATPIPTYSQHKHNYWAVPPVTVAED